MYIEAHTQTIKRVDILRRMHTQSYTHTWTHVHYHILKRIDTLIHTAKHTYSRLRGYTVCV